MQLPDFVVIGAGLLGMLTAKELAEAGARVRIVEKGAVGRESSWAGGGILSPLYPWRYPESVTALCRWSQARYPDISRELSEASGIDPEWTRNGLLMLDTLEEQQAREWAARHGYRLELLRGEEVAACEPTLGNPPEAALWMEEVAQVRNPRLLQALRIRIGQLGISVDEGSDVHSIRLSHDRAVAVVTSNEEIEVGRGVVVAGGAWSSELLRETGWTVPVRPVRGQMLLYRTEPDTVRRIVLSEGRYLIPRRDGRLLVGSTVEEAGFEKRTTEEATSELTAAALRLVPALARFPIERQWAGLRPGSPEGVPFIGPHPTVRGLFVNTGHFRNGVVMGLASARLAADLMLGRPPTLEPAPYALDREAGAQ